MQIEVKSFGFGWFPNGMSHDTRIEHELRYKLVDREGFEAALKTHGAKLIRQEHLIDHWFIPNEIQNSEQQKRWFDIERGCSIRIREIILNDGSRKVVLGTKRIMRAEGHNSLAEVEIGIENYARAKDLLVMMDRKEFLTIDKERSTYEVGEFEISIDEVKGYGVGVEIEYRGGDLGSDVIGRITKLAASLGLHESDRHEKSITVSAMEILARY